MCGFSHWSTAARVCASLLDWLPIGWAPVCPCRVTSFIQRLGAHSSFDHTGVHQVVVFCRFGHFSSNVQVLSSFVQETIFWITGHLSLQSGGGGGHTLACPNPLIADGFPIVAAHQWGCPCIIQSVTGPVVPHGSHARISLKVSFDGSAWLVSGGAEACTSSRVTGGPVPQSAYRWTCIPVCLQVDFYPSLLSPVSVVPLELVTMISCSLVLSLLRTAGQ